MSKQHLHSELLETLGQLVIELRRSSLTSVLTLRKASYMTFCFQSELSLFWNQFFTLSVISKRFFATTAAIEHHRHLGFQDKIRICCCLHHQRSAGRRRYELLNRKSCNVQTTAIIKVKLKPIGQRPAIFPLPLVADVTVMMTKIKIKDAITSNKKSQMESHLSRALPRLAADYYLQFDKRKSTVADARTAPTTCAAI